MPPPTNRASEAHEQLLWRQELAARPGVARRFANSFQAGPYNSHMNAPGRVLVSICAAVVTLPLSPCAFVAAACKGHELQAKREAAQAPQRSCCSSQPADEPSQPQPSKPYSGECCRISPFTKTGETVDLGLAAAALTILTHVDVTPTGDAPFLPVAVPQPLSLHILHCQWRC